MKKWEEGAEELTRIIVAWCDSLKAEETKLGKRLDKLEKQMIDFGFCRYHEISADLKTRRYASYADIVRYGTLVRMKKVDFKETSNSTALDECSTTSSCSSRRRRTYADVVRGSNLGDLWQ